MYTTVELHSLNVQMKGHSGLHRYRLKSKVCRESQVRSCPLLRLIVYKHW